MKRKGPVRNARYPLQRRLSDALFEPDGVSPLAGLDYSLWYRSQFRSWESHGSMSTYFLANKSRSNIVPISYLPERRGSSRVCMKVACFRRHILSRSVAKIPLTGGRDAPKFRIETGTTVFSTTHDPSRFQDGSNFTDNDEIPLVRRCRRRMLIFQ